MVSYFTELSKKIEKVERIEGIFHNSLRRER